MKPTWCTKLIKGLYNGTKSVARGAMFWEDLNVTNKTKRNKWHIEMKLHLHLRMVLVVLVHLEKLEEFPSLQQMDMGLKIGDQDIQILWRHVIVLTSGFF